MITSPGIITTHQDHEIDIVYLDEFLLVVNKPPDLLAVPGRGPNNTENLTTRIQRKFPEALIVHRLDMSTSGLLMLARSKEVQSHLSSLFRERKVQKRYTAIITGRIEHTHGEIELPLAPDWPNRPRQKVDISKGKCSLTRYHVLSNDTSSCTSRIELEPVTGRTHQLRVHLMAIGHPIVGDKLYGVGPGTCPQRLMLHASKLSFIHPGSAKQLSLSCEATF